MNPFWIGPAVGWAAPAAAWMLTYLLHSTVLLGLAAAAGWLLGERRPALQEVVWRCALIGGLATATLQLGAGWTPLAGAWELPSAAAERTVEASSPAVESLPLAARLDEPANAATAAHQRRAFAGGGDTVGRPEAAPAAGSPPLVAPAPSRLATADGVPTTGSVAAAASSSWPFLAVAVWLAAALVLVGRLGADYLRLAVRLRERWPVADGAVAALFGRLLGRSGRRRPVELSGSERLPVPIAWGLARPEVSLPARVLSDLSPYHQESILAHELAHVLRRDPAWLAAARLIEAVLFFQPLNRLARRRLQELAEVHCDDRAVELTGKPLELARCLTEVATWRMTGLAALPVPSMASGSALGRRVRRLVDGERGERLSGWVRPVAGVALLAVALGAPGVTRGKPAAPQAPVTGKAAEAPTAVPVPPPAAPEDPDNGGWVVVDGRSWNEMTPAEQDEIRRDLALSREHAQRAGREARASAAEAREAVRRALDEVRAQLRHQGEELRGTAGERREALAAAREAHRHALEEVQRNLRDGRGERVEHIRRQQREIERRIHRDVERQLRDARRQAEDHATVHGADAARLRAEALAAASAGLEEVERMVADGTLERHAALALTLGESLPALIEGSLQLGLGSAGMALAGLDMPEIEAEIAAAMAELEHEMPEIEKEIAAAMAELTAERPEIEAEIAAAMAEVEAELAAEMPRIEAELAAARLEVERELAAERPQMEAEMAAAMAEVEAELAAGMPEIEAEIEAAMAEVERELAALEAELAAEEAEIEAEAIEDEP